MNTLSFHKAVTLSLACLSIHCTSAAGEAPALKALEGRWTITKTNREGAAFLQVIEIHQDQLTFQILGSDGKLRLISRGTAKAEQTGPFQVLSVAGLRVGTTEEDMQAIDDTRAMIYTVREDKLILASNFDKERSGERPGVEVYARQEGATGESKLAGTWKVEVTLADTRYDYELRIAKGAGRLDGVLVSPRSGEHKCKSVQIRNDEVIIEIDRELQGNPITFVYQGKLEDKTLSGKAYVKGQEDQLSGPWKATRK